MKRTKRFAPLVYCIAALVASPARPVFAETEDGGARSVFASGAGIRALSMGGAFVAVSDDASAALWNPGGLGLLQNRTFEVSHANLGLVDLDEQYASLAIPSWRWGTTAVSFRRYAIDGVERRDDRNAIVGGALEDRQSELKLSYGRAVRDAWSVGGAFKVRRQSLAGFSASALGLDLGVTARPGVALGRETGWASRVSAGLALRNVLEPKLRLDREEVVDPATAQVGAAYRHSFGRAVGLLAAIDMEKSARTAWNPRIGGETTVMNILALRGGVNDDSWSAGAGVAWKGVHVDYAFEENEIDTIQRFGVSFAFGPTVEESRAATALREEEVLRARLAESFERRQNDRIGELLNGARARLDAKEFDAALEILAAVTALEPGHAPAAALQVECYKRQAADLEASSDFAGASIAFGRALALVPEDAEAFAGSERCRAEGAKRAARSEKIRDLFNASLDAFSAGDLRTAERKLSAILEVEPKDTEAQALLRRTRVAIESRTRDLSGQARRLLDAGLVAEAETLADEIRSLDPKAKGLAELSLSIRSTEVALATKARLAKDGSANVPTPGGTGRVAPTTPSAPIVMTPKSAALSKKKRKDLADLYKRGMSAMQDGQADDALRYWELVWLGDPEYEGVADHLKREYLLRGLESFSSGGLDVAIQLWEKALAVDPKDEKTIRYLARAREQLNRSREILGEKPEGSR